MQTSKFTTSILKHSTKPRSNRQDNHNDHHGSKVAITTSLPVMVQDGRKPKCHGILIDRNLFPKRHRPISITSWTLKRIQHSALSSYRHGNYIGMNDFDFLRTDRGAYCAGTPAVLGAASRR